MEGGGGGGEVRRVHVVYILSRNGEMEHPHLIRVRHQPRRDGVRLRDVKRWLSELRGKDMPDSFAWSYKRRYKTGYVWQDLADDDLITPLSDNEYVLKGSLTTPAVAAAAAAISIRSSCSSFPVFSSASAATFVTRSSLGAETYPQGSPPGDPKTARPPETLQAEDADHYDKVSPPQANEEEAGDEGRRYHSVPPTHHSDSSRCGGAAVEHIDPLQTGPQTAPPPQSSDGSACEIVEEDGPGIGGEEKTDATRNASYSTLLSGREQRSYTWCGVAGGRVSYAFRNLLRCGAGAAEVNDSALLPINPCRRGQLRGGGGESGRGGSCRGGGEAVVLSGKSRRSSTGGGARWMNDLVSCPKKKGQGGGKSSPTSRAGEVASEQKKTTVPTEAYKAALPSCSQCGRPFKPQRLHSHMRSCKALKAQRRNSSSGELPKGADSCDEKLFKEASSFFLLSH